MKQHNRLAAACHHVSDPNAVGVKELILGESGHNIRQEGQHEDESCFRHQLLSQTAKALTQSKTISTNWVSWELAAIPALQERSHSDSAFRSSANCSRRGHRSP